MVSEGLVPISFVDLAMQRARGLASARQDLPHLIFPASHFPIDEHLVSAVKNSLYMLVFNIERAILRQSSMTDKIGDMSKSYPILLESSLLNDSKILDMCLSLFHYQSLYFSSGKDEMTSAAQEYLTSFNDPKIEQSLKIMALGHSRLKSLTLGNYFELSPEVLHLLTWRIVATFEILYGEIHPELVKGVNIWLSQYDEANSIASSSGKLIYRLNKQKDFDAHQILDFHAADAGLFIAMIAQLTQIDRHIILNILTDRSPILAALLFRAIDMDKSLALHNISKIFKAEENDLQNIIYLQIAKEYHNIKPEMALQKLSHWSSKISSKDEMSTDAISS